MRGSALLLATALVLSSTEVFAGGGEADLGRAFAEAECSQCHAIGEEAASPLKEAPPFREIVTLYPPESLAEALAEGIVTGHPGMPQFELEPDQIGDFIAYLETLIQR
ncbi:MAG: cytochrome c [Hyphomicrobiales bacterium]|nr:cytochrome c [Hyphomicrobiales bacterium]